MPLAVGARIGPYEILASLGAGGMGEVYHAHDPRLERTVAIKVLTSARDSTPTELERFQREARAIARVNHPHICGVHDVGHADGVAYLVMELLEGETLAERLERGPMPVNEAVDTAVQIAQALDAAHRKGVIHRDLKPSNVMLTASGVKLLDFGLAKLRDGGYDEPAELLTRNLPLTGEGSVLGTLPYMAPEQVEGRDADARTDTFALGVVIFEMTTGCAPFQGASRASLTSAILTHEPPPVSSLAPQADAGLDRIVKKCLAKDPDDRWQSAQDLASALRWSTDQEPGRNIAAGGATTRRRGGRTMVVVALAGGAALIAVAIRALVGTGAFVPLPPPVPEYRQVTYRRGLVSAARFTPDGQSFVYSARWEGRPYGVYLGRRESPDARDLGLESGRILSISRAGDIATLFGPQTITQSFGVRTLARVPLAGGSRRDLLTGIVDADWIPGTEAVAVIRDPGGGRPWTVEFPAGKTVHQARAAWSLRVSTDGTRIAFFEEPSLFDSAPEAMITVIDKAGGRTTVSRNWAGLGLAWTPAGDEIWFTANRGGRQPPQLHAVSLSGVERTVNRAPDWLVLHDISAQGDVLLSRNSIRISTSCQARGDTRERDLSWLVASTVSGLSSDGQTAIFVDALSGRTPAGNPMIFRRSIDGSPAVALGEGGVGPLSPDGQWVLSPLKGSLILLPTGAGSMVTLPKGNLARAGGGAWLADSKRIVFTADRGDNTPRGYIQEIPDGSPRAFTPDHVVLANKGAVRDHATVLGRSGDQWSLYPIEGGKAQAIAALTPRDIPVQWSEDGRFVYVVDRRDGPPEPAFDVTRVEPATGRRVLWKTLGPRDPVGAETSGQIVMTPDASSYCYSYSRRLGDLFVVEGLK